MVDISPFRGLVYNEKKAGALSSLVSPPYDVISGDLRKKLIGSDHHNIVNLILPEGKIINKYDNAKDLLNDWINKDILQFDNNKAYYMIEIGFNAGGKAKSITGFIGLTNIEPYSKNIVLRHEKTLAKPRKDRYSLLKSSRTNFGLIYTIYRDRKKLVPRVLESYRNTQPFADIIPGYDRNLSLKLWRITDKKDIAIITDSMMDKKILIADGHHRYETSLIYRDESGVSGTKSVSGKEQSPEKYVLTLFMESGQEEIKIYPTYRSIKFNDFNDFGIFLKKSSKCFNINNINPKNADDIACFLDRLREKSVNGFIFYVKKDNFYSFTAKTDITQIEDCSFSGKKLDVDILHGLLINNLEDLYGKSKIIYDHDFDLIIESVNNGSTDLGVFLNPPTIEEMEEICNSGKLMPQKSTFFWPKPSTGLVMYKFDIKK
jgi:uncharacterized protein (DUF1015 family)